MGEISEMFLNGDMCQICGEILDGNGYAQTCTGCQSSSKETTTTKNGIPVYRPSKINCPVCNKLVKKVGIENHMKAKHQGGE